jgi:inner membrane transporter RhtA
VSAQQARTGTLMAVTAMVSVQLGMAVAVGLIDHIGSDGTAWLRLAWAGVILLVVVRPRPSAFTRKTFGMCVLLGIVSAAVSLFFMASLDRLPLGTATALEFLGPLAVAAAHGSGRRRFLWPGLAAVGVVLLSEPFTGGVDGVGVLLALAAGAAWALYILLTQNVGDQVAGVTGLAVSMPVAGVVATFTVSPAVFERMTPEILLIGLGMAILLPVVPFVLELLALRNLTTAAFGTLMCLEPALAFLVGFTLLHQRLDPVAVIGILVVVIAGVGAARSGGRQSEIHIEIS